MVLVPLERVHALVSRQVRLGRHSRGKHQLFGPQRHFGAVAVDHHCPFLFSLIISGGFAGGFGPVVQLHHLGIHLQPVPDLVLGGEDGPVIREFDVGEVIVPNRIVQAK